MNQSRTIATVAMIVAFAAYLAPAVLSPAMADDRWHRDRYWQPRPYAKNLYRNGGVRYYNSPRAYRSACGYGDCACLRSLAIRTGNQVWWDKLQACTG